MDDPFLYFVVLLILPFLSEIIKGSFNLLAICLSSYSLSFREYEVGIERELVIISKFSGFVISLNLLTLGWAKFVLPQSLHCHFDE